MKARSYLRFLTLLPVVTFPAYTQTSLASRVLVLYNPMDANSAAVAAHYQTARAVPNANMCAVNVSSSASTNLAYSDYVSLIKTPVQACLNSVGSQNILYILLAYLRPLTLQTTTGLTFSVDSFLADIWDQYATQFFNPVPTAVHRYYAESQSQGNSFIPFQSLATYRTTARAQLIYSVWRLDGPTVAIANAQVDGATAAMAGGGPPISQVSGSRSNACVDMKESTSGIPDSGLASVDWDLFRASQILAAANQFSVITDMLPTQFGTSPSPICPNTGLYVGWYNYGSYNNAFSWDQGSIGWDIDSGALADTRNGPWWGAGAIAAGISVTSGPVTEPFTAGIVKPAVIRNLFEGANVGDAFLRNTHWLKWMTVNVGDPLYQPFPGGVSPFNPPAAANSMAAFINQATFRQYVGGNPVALNISVPNAGPIGWTDFRAKHEYGWA